MNVKASFSNDFKQARIFEKALSRVIELNGPLHMSFHILQCIYIIFGKMMEWGKAVVDWKRIKLNKVSESFELCKQLLFLMLDEASRLSWDLFVHENKLLINSIINYSSGAEYVIFHITTAYCHFIDGKVETSCSNREKYFYSFIVMARKFWLFWNAIRTGDRLMQENLVNYWLPVFYMLKKNNFNS